MKFWERFYIESFFGNDKEYCEDILLHLNEHKMQGKIIWTTRIDLGNASLETLKKELRTDIKYGVKSGLSIVKINKDNIHDFSKYIFKEFRASYKKNQILIPSYDYYKSLILSWLDLFLVYKEDILLWWDFISKNNWMALARSTFTTELWYNLKLRSWEYLRWHIINYLKNSWIKYFDLNMISINWSKKQDCINSYKLKRWGDIIYWINLVL